MALRSTIKLGIVGGACYTVYNTSEIWSDSTRASKFVKETCDNSPTLKYYCKAMPSAEDAKITVIDTWNSGVKAVFASIADLPQTGKKAACWTMRKMKELSATPDVKENKAELSDKKEKKT